MTVQLNKINPSIEGCEHQSVHNKGKIEKLSMLEMELHHNIYKNTCTTIELLQ
jgi:hypothetical protein